MMSSWLVARMSHPGCSLVGWRSDLMISLVLRRVRLRQHFADHLMLMVATVLTMCSIECSMSCYSLNLLCWKSL